MTTVQAEALTVALRAVFTLSANGYAQLAAELETTVAALSDEANNQRIRAEAAEAELREMREDLRNRAMEERTRG